METLLQLIGNLLIVFGAGIAAGVVLSLVIFTGLKKDLKRRNEVLKLQNDLLLAEVADHKKYEGWLREANQELCPHEDFFKKKYLTEENYRKGGTIEEKVAA